ncbi:MAG: tRNA glutamyl-Q(34) synthetase GluQRS, partial [Ilumatobacteraceae bacterium]
MTGRFAPSPTGDLHLGNLRTAAVAWLSARAQRSLFFVRMEDLDRHQSNVANERRQLRDLTALGLDWDGEVLRQSDRFAIYDAAIDHLRGRGLVYECYCTRREILAEIAESSAAPHRPPGSYPGTCRDLDADAVAAHRDAGRRPALRLRTDGRPIAFEDRIVGHVEGIVDDVVLRRNDGVPAYNLAVVVDDGAQGVDDVVRGDDLASSTPRQIHLQRLLGLRQPTYTHVPLVLGTDGERLAKRHGAVTLGDLEAAGVSERSVIGWIAETLGLARAGEPVTLQELVDRYDPTRLPTAPI